MHISRLRLINYRNFANAEIRFNKGVNTIIGENGSGKTNLFRAMRLLLDDGLLRFAHKLEAKDFHRGLGDWRGHWIIIGLEFREVAQDEALQALFLHGTGNIGKGAIERATYTLVFRPKAAIRFALAELDEGDKAALLALRERITIDDYETVFLGKSEADFNDPAVYRAVVGDFEAVRFNLPLDPPEIGGRVPGILSLAKEVSFTFVQALRDVVSDFQSNRTNPLLTLLKSKSGEIDTERFAPISAQAADLNRNIEALPDVDGVRSDIRTTISEAAGETYAPAALSIRSDLPSEADRLFQSLKLFVGESEPGHEAPVHELSLGGANLIYLTLKLLEFKYQRVRQPLANFLLIEEPEAHIHTHIQKTLFDKLSYENTQVIYSTHSTHISEVSNVENITILGREGGVCEAYQPSRGLDPTEVRNIQRYLDAVRSNLLFAKSVILVEGDAEEILIPLLIKGVLGVSLDELGISLINIRSTGFKNVAVLFHDKRIRKRCAIVTDLDACFFDVEPADGDDAATEKAKKHAKAAAAVGLRRRNDLTEFIADNPWLGLFLAKHTFEVDFVDAGNEAAVVSALGSIYTDASTIAHATTELELGLIELAGKRTLTMAENVGKGWFAILLGKAITPDTVIPRYIVDAVFFAHRRFSVETYYSMLSYRLSLIAHRNDPNELQQLKIVEVVLADYRKGEASFDQLRDAMLINFPADQINTILADR